MITMEPRHINGISYRQGTVADGKRVADITKDGAEAYLPWFYHVACQTKGHHLFVAEAGEILVSLIK